VTSRQDNGEYIAVQISSVIRSRNRSSIFGGEDRGLLGVSLSTEGNGGGGGGGIGGVASVGGVGVFPGTDKVGGGVGGVGGVGVFPVVVGGLGLGFGDAGTGAGVNRLPSSITGVVAVGVVGGMTGFSTGGLVC
jgi:hypothetical protein